VLIGVVAEVVVVGPGVVIGVLPEFLVVVVVVLVVILVVVLLVVTGALPGKHWKYQSFTLVQVAPDTQVVPPITMLLVAAHNKDEGETLTSPAITTALCVQLLLSHGAGSHEGYRQRADRKGFEHVEQMSMSN
jgi:hypothetical protein